MAGDGFVAPSAVRPESVRAVVAEAAPAQFGAGTALSSSLAISASISSIIAVAA